MIRDLIGRYDLDLALPASLVIIAESLIFAGYMQAAMVVHALNLAFLILSSVYINNRIYPALMLLPLFRLLNIAMPVFFQLTLYSYSLVYAPMFIPIYFVLKEGFVSPAEAGLTLKGFGFYMFLAVAVGFALGWGEFNVLHSVSLVPGPGLIYVLVFVNHNDLLRGPCGGVRISVRPADGHARTSGLYSRTAGDQRALRHDAQRLPSAPGDTVRLLCRHSLRAAVLVDQKPASYRSGPRGYQYIPLLNSARLFLVAHLSDSHPSAVVRANPGT